MLFFKSVNMLLFWCHLKQFRTDNIIMMIIEFAYLMWFSMQKNSLCTSFWQCCVQTLLWKTYKSNPPQNKFKSYILQMDIESITSFSHFINVHIALLAHIMSKAVSAPLPAPLISLCQWCEFKYIFLHRNSNVIL